MVCVCVCVCVRVCVCVCVRVCVCVCVSSHPLNHCWHSADHIARLDAFSLTIRCHGSPSTCVLHTTMCSGVLIATKIDLTGQRVVPTDAASAFATQNGLQYFEVSAVSLGFACFCFCFCLQFCVACFGCLSCNTCGWRVTS
jgi:hypothetical protein